MITIASIVEGQGEVTAVPILLRRIASEVSPNIFVNARRPIRVRRHGVLKEKKLEDAVDLAGRQVGKQLGGILILLDADDDCPKHLAEEVLRRARAARSDQHIRVVLAKREYEAWFLAAARSIAGKREIDKSTLPPAEPESIRGAKGWLDRRMPKKPRL